MPQSPNDWNSYLEMLDLGNPTLAAYLRSALPPLVDAVPPAGQYTTSMDYTTLKPALTAQYVGEVIQKYESMLGSSPELYQAAVAGGYLTQEQANAMGSQSSTGVGSVQQQFAAKGGLRTLAGPYQAARTDILKQALADMQTASEKASTDAYQLASQTTGQRVTALSNAGGLGAQLVGQGVSRMNAKGAAEMGGEAPGMELPAPPERNDPSIWEKILMGALPAGIAAGGALLGRSLAPGREQTNPLIARDKAETEYNDYKAQRDAPERPPGYGEDQTPQYNTANPYSAQTATYGEAPYGGGQQAMATPMPTMGAGTSPYQGAQQQAYGWQAPMPQWNGGNDTGLGNASWNQPNYGYGSNNNGSGIPSYSGGYDDPYQGYDYGGGQQPQYSGGYDDPYQGYDYGGGGGGYDYSNYAGWYE